MCQAVPTLLWVLRNCCLRGRHSTTLRHLPVSLAHFDALLGLISILGRKWKIGRHFVVVVVYFFVLLFNLVLWSLKILSVCLEVSWGKS